MSGAVASTYASLKAGLGNVTLSPLKSAYHFIFSPLEDLLLVHGGEYAPHTTTTASGRAHDARRAAALEGYSHRDLLHHSTSRGGVGDDDRLGAAWDGFGDSPWSFVTSRYAVALFAMALLTNRIQHICRPRGGRAVRLPQSTRLALRLPSLLLLARAVLILAVITPSLFFSDSSPINRLIRILSTKAWREAWLGYAPTGGWADDFFGSESHEAIARARDAAALWASFTATCVAVITESLIRSLEADREEAPSFNLVGFAFLLHFHSFSPDYQATKHVYLCILLQLAEVFAVGITKCRKKPLAPRLVVTSVFGIASTLHYLLTLSDGSYPFMQAFSRAPEIALMIIVLLTVALHALTMFLTGERVELGRLLFNRSNLPSMHDDWSLALFKVGTACLESTRLTGLSQEVAPLQAYEGPFVEMRRDGNVRIVDAHAGLSGRSFQPADGGDGGSRQGQGQYEAIGGFGREIKQVRVEDSVAARPSGLVSSARYREAKRFSMQLYRTLRGLVVLGTTRLCTTLGLPLPSVPRWVYPVLRRVRLLWHGRNGEERREQRLAEQHRTRLSQESRRAYIAWVSGREGAATAATTPPPGSLAARMRPRPQRIASADMVALAQQQQQQRASSDQQQETTATTAQDDTAQPAAGRARPRSRAASPSPSSSLLDAMLWQRFLAPDAPILEEDEDEDDGDFEENEDDGEEENEASGDEDDERRWEGAAVQQQQSGVADDVGSQPQARLAHLARAAAAEQNNVDEDDEDDEPNLDLPGTDERLLLAHLIRGDDGPPLTRSSYRSLVGFNARRSRSGRDQALGDDGSNRRQEVDLLAVIARRRNELETSRAASGLDVEAERRRLCVVCCVEERNVICWPCRCLCLCTECREHLASRPPHRSPANGGGGVGAGGSAHLCPTCRTPVEAFSRLYLP